MDIIHIIATVVFLITLILVLVLVCTISLINKLEIRILNRIRRMLKLMEQYNERIYELEKKTLEFYSKYK